MNKREQEVVRAAINWYREALRTRDKLSPGETKLFYAVSLLENSQVIDIPKGLYEEDENSRSTTPAPSPLLDELLERSKSKDTDGK